MLISASDRVNGSSRWSQTAPNIAAVKTLETACCPVNEFGKYVEAEIPRLRRYPRALFRNRAAADDLVQNCIERALAKRHLWKPGTSMRAWLFTIMHNQYVTQVRRAVREGVAVSISETEPSLTRAADQGKRLELRDLDRALARLPNEQRVVILLVGLEGLSYEAVAEAIGVPVGTVRSRLSRGREALRRLMVVMPNRQNEAAGAPLASLTGFNALALLAA
jgi:RNA polymerase sigma-70 factor (ECF subfamily)